MVQEGQVVSLNDVFTQGLRIMEHEIVDMLLPNLQQEVLGIGFVQKQTDAGEKSRFKACVIVGNEAGYVGIGEGKASEIGPAIRKAILRQVKDPQDLKTLIKVYNKEFGGGHTTDAGMSAWDYHATNYDLL
jgi:ribosomal protein S5